MKRAKQISGIALNLAFATALLAFSYLGYRSYVDQHMKPTFYHGDSKADVSPAKVTKPNLTVRTT